VTIKSIMENIKKIYFTMVVGNIKQIK